jgi:hypothetical protein
MVAIQAVYDGNVFIHQKRHLIPYLPHYSARRCLAVDFPVKMSYYLSKYE